MKKRPALTKREQRVEDWFEFPMIIVTIVLIVTFLVPLLVPLSPTWVWWFAFLNITIWTTFYFELFVKLYVAAHKWQALQRNWSLAVIVVIPLLLPLRIMRVSRLFGLIRLLRLQPAVDKLKKRVRALVYSLEYILITIVTFVLSTGFILWQVETRFDGTLTSLPDALWWSLATITTIGIPETVPTSIEGRVLGVLISISGTILLIIFIAKVTATFLKKTK